MAVIEPRGSLKGKRGSCRAAFKGGQMPASKGEESGLGCEMEEDGGFFVVAGVALEDGDVAI